MESQAWRLDFYEGHQHAVKVRTDSSMPYGRPGLRQGVAESTPHLFKGLGRLLFPWGAMICSPKAKGLVGLLLMPKWCALILGIHDNPRP